MIVQEKKKKDYQMLSVKSNMVFTYDDLSKKFNYKPTIFEKSKKLEMEGWNVDTVAKIVNDILNNSNYQLIAVSEDSDYLRYHFVS